MNENHVVTAAQLQSAAVRVPHGSPVIVIVDGVRTLIDHCETIEYKPGVGELILILNWPAKVDEPETTVTGFVPGAYQKGSGV